MKSIYLFCIFLALTNQAMADTLVGQWKLTAAICPDNKPLPENTALSNYEPIIQSGLYVEFTENNKTIQTILSPVADGAIKCTIRSTMNYNFTGTELTMSSPSFDLSECNIPVVKEELSKPVERQSLTVSAVRKGNQLIFTHAADPLFQEGNCSDQVRVIEIYELQNN